MIVRLITIFGFVVTASCTSTADRKLVVEWKQTVTTVLAHDLSGESCVPSPYKFGETELERDQIIAQISNDVATCWANAYESLANEKGIRIKDVFVDPARAGINDSLFSYEEINGKIRNCGRNAFNNAGIEYD